MSIDLSTSRELLLALLPELVLTGWALVLLVVVAWRHRTAQDLRIAGWITLVALASTAVAVWWLWWNEVHSDGITPMIAVDDFRYVADWLFLGAAALTTMFSFHYLEREQLLAPEYYVLLVFATLGMMLMAGGEDLFVIFLGLELMSVAVYVLAGFDRKSPRAAEAALKYFLLGAFASAFLLYGIALVYGATGTTNLTLIGVQVASLGLGTNVLLLLGLGLLLVGFGFKVAAVPFHMWAPDVYDGAPTPVTGFMATAVKAAAFAALARVLIEAFADTVAWQGIVVGLSVVTMIVGNLVALAQRSLKRMLAYSSVAHAGYLLVAVAVGDAQGTAAVLFYLAAYGLTTLAAFALLAAKGRAGANRRSRGAVGRPAVARLRARGLHAVAARLPRHRRIHREMVHPRRGDGGGEGVARRGAGPDERRIRGLLPAGDHGDVHAAHPVCAGARRRAVRAPRPGGPGGMHRGAAVFRHHP
jgi:NADH-quinone oxidoreductase subunit N